MDKQGSWFARLDWTDDDKFENFGANKSVHQRVVATDYLVDPADPASQSLPRRGGRRPSKAAKPNAQGKKPANTILAKLAEDSRKALEENFDQTGLRQKIVE